MMHSQTLRKRWKKSKTLAGRTSKRADPYCGNSTNHHQFKLFAPPSPIPDDKGGALTSGGTKKLIGFGLGVEVKRASNWEGSQLIIDESMFCFTESRYEG